MIVVYGFDGDLAVRLGQLAEALSAIGWVRSGPLPLRDWVDAGGYAVLDWRPTDTLPYPPGMAGTPPWGRPPLLPHMRLSWSSRGQETGLRPDPNRTRANTRNYLAVQPSGTEYWKLSDIALADYEHTLAVIIELAYYSNLNARARSHRIPRYLRPTPVRSMFGAYDKP